ncbi:hypothetical protein ACH5RR_001420 [Cinchona calisaya]|uniref:RING-type E3 ubiquitin transferase n=1 Tax=Cinchona calisaya TaxID=153742 RepID=A0ABD3B4K8_9GENT
MGQIWSKRQQNHPHYRPHHHHHHRHRHHHHHHHLHPPPPPPPPPPQQPPPSSTLPTSYAFAANAPYPALPPPPPSLPYHPSSYNYNYNYSNYSRPTNMMGAQSNHHNPYSYVGHGNGGWFRQPAPAMLLAPSPALQQPPPPPPPVPYVDHQSAKKIKNDVNVHKDTIKLDVDEGYKDCHLVSFTFDALVDGSITIYYFAKEGTKCTFTPLYPEVHVPVKISFRKGLGQKFCQPSGSGIDLGFFDTDDLSKPSVGDVFPLVISAESCLPSTSMYDESNEEAVHTTPHAQITQAVIETNHEDHFQVKVIKQILWIDEVRYELREIFGISNEDERAINDKDSGKECVICMTDPKNTAVLPCRHMCMCSECAKELRLQSNKCPICRQPIEELLEIKVDEAVS